jgi:Ca2+-binding RTX toxin-like protein
MINWTTITNRTDYENLRYAFLLKTEEQGTPELLPYNDGAAPLAAGNITIGVGFNLEGSVAVRDEVFRTFGLIRNNPALSTTPPAPGQLSAQQVENNYIDQLVAAIQVANTDFSALHAIMVARAANTSLAALGTRRSAFAFNDEPEIRATFDRLMTNIYEPKVNSWLSGIPDSRERTALISLAWNQKDSSPLLGNKLKAAVVNGDRAEAWYEIRYNSNSAGQRENIRNGIAKRRYFEADTFGLYNNAAANNNEDAKGAFRAYTRHKTEIDSYDTQFGTQVALANSDYNTTVVQTRAAWHQPARVYLVAQYSQGLSITGDLLVGENNGAEAGTTNTTYYRTTDRDVLIGNDTATSKNDLIFGESGNDVIQGGLGNDVLYGGTGVDLYRYRPNDGADIITDTDAQGAIVYDPEGTSQALVLGLRQPTDPAGVYKSPDGTMTYTWSGTPNTDLTIQTPTGTLTVKNYAQGKLRIALIDVPTNATGTTLMGNTGNNTTAYYSGGIWNNVVNPRLILHGDYDNAGNTTNDALGNLVAAPDTALIQGLDGHDALIGNGRPGLRLYGGADMLDGGSQEDRLYGGAGDDALLGGADNDRLYGDTDLWNIIWDRPTGQYTLLYGAQGFSGTYAAMHDVAPAEAGNDVLQGGAGTDMLYGGAGDDVLDGGTERDVLQGEGGADTLFGGAGDDDLWGGSDPLTITEDAQQVPGDYGTYTYYWRYRDVGTDGDDLLAGGTGTDRLYGGLGNDTYLFNRGDGQDTVTEEGGQDTLTLGRGIFPTDVTLSFSGANLIVNPGAGDSITLTAWKNLTNRVEYLQFAEGATWNLKEKLKSQGIQIADAGDFLTDEEGTDTAYLSYLGPNTPDVGPIDFTINIQDQGGLDTLRMEPVNIGPNPFGGYYFLTPALTGVTRQNDDLLLDVWLSFGPLQNQPDLRGQVRLVNQIAGGALERVDIGGFVLAPLTGAINIPDIYYNSAYPDLPWSTSSAYAYSSNNPQR